jgi:hypothetical protein
VKVVGKNIELYCVNISARFKVLMWASTKAQGFLEVTIFGLTPRQELNFQINPVFPSVSE